MAALRKTTLAASVFFTVCGTEPGQACVIERAPRSAVVRPLDGPALVQANHHVAARFAAHNADLDDVPEDEQEFSREGSAARAEALARALATAGGPGGLEEAARVLDAAPVLNKFTCQQLAFCPRTGGVRVWRRRTRGRLRGRQRLTTLGRPRANPVAIRGEPLAVGRTGVILRLGVVW